MERGAEARSSALLGGEALDHRDVPVRLRSATQTLTRRGVLSSARNFDRPKLAHASAESGAVHSLAFAQERQLLTISDQIGISRRLR